MDFNYSKIKQLNCSGVKQLDGWMTTKIVTPNVNSGRFYPATGNG
jgi:hypothetical protein